MDRRKASRSTLMLAELLIVILIFALCAAVCLSLFGTASRMSADSDRLNHAVSLSKSVASCYKAADGELHECVALLDASEDVLAEWGFVLYYDTEWQRVSAACDKGFYLKLAPKTAAERALIREAEITVCHMDGTQIFALTVKKAVPHAGGELHEPK